MNSADICHQVSDCTGLFVDAFRGNFLRNHTKNPDATFVLSHYHGDHYQNLPRDSKYQGPAKIHCTPVTARLLVGVHKVPEKFVMEHEYGSTFYHHILQQKKNKNDPDNYAKITFYDANHCPGACIILIELPDGKTTHLHTGDMRYHPRFQSYPLLARSVQQRKLDLVYLDTTYCHPKHDFVTQEEAVDSIASQTQQLLSDNSKRKNSKNTLVLLSCYSIGKEKVMYEASKRSRQLIYVNDKKWKMLQCIQQDQSKGERDSQKQQQQDCVPTPSFHEKTSSLSHQQHTNILERCTRDPSLSDLHVIPMGLAGEMWPYFQPNFQKIAKYVEDLSSLETENDEKSDTKSTEEDRVSRKEKQGQCGDYDKVVAFIPTGWANASNWNKKNAISTKKIELSSSKSLHVEVRLISYSEHSTFPELISFIQYLKPRKIIPTVYSDQNHKRQIEGRFRNMLDSTRAKQAFFRSMTKNENTTALTSAVLASEQNSPTSITVNSKSIIEVSDNSALSNNGTTPKEETSTLGVQSTDDKDCSARKDNSKSIVYAFVDEVDEDDEEIEVAGVIQAKNSPLLSGSGDSSKNQRINNDKINMLVSMGFDKQRAQIFLEKCDGNIEAAIDKMLSEKEQKNEDNNQTKHLKQGIGAKDQSPCPTATKKMKISDFFVRRK